MSKIGQVTTTLGKASIIWARQSFILYVEKLNLEKLNAQGKTFIHPNFLSCMYIVHCTMYLVLIIYVGLDKKQHRQVPTDTQSQLPMYASK